MLGAPRYQRPLALQEIVFTALEAAIVLLPLDAFFRLDEEQRLLLRRVGPVVLLAAYLSWWILQRFWRRPLDRALAQRRAGTALSPEAIAAAYETTLEWPRRVAFLRTSLATVGATVIGVLLALRTSFPPVGVITIVAISALHVFGVEIFRVVSYTHILGKARTSLLPEIDFLRQFRDQYFERLMRGALATGVLGIVAIAAFSYFLLPLNLEQYSRLETWFSFTVIGLTAVWAVLALRLPRPIDRYLEAETSPNPKERPTAGDARAIAAYRVAQSLPYKFAVAKVGFWVVAEALLVLQARPVFGIDLENAILLFGQALVVTVGVAIYEALWHRATLRPLLAHIAIRHRPKPDTVRTPLSLRNKMLASFGGLTFFACGLSLFWSFVQYKTMATAFIQRSSELRLDRMISQVQAQGAHLGRVLTTDEVAQALRAEVDDEAVVYYLPPEERARPQVFGGGRAGPPPLPWVGEAVMRRFERGSMELLSLHLAGSHARLYDFRHHDLGAIAVLYADYRGPGRVAIDNRITILLLFFVLLSALSMGIVVLVVADLTEPIRHLERRAGAMAQGDLTRPVLHVAGEADEVGRLTFAFEEMRRALNEKLRSSTEINISLEHEVTRRTAELERRNQELKDALDALQRTQAELVRSEKMASMGRLVAGIAHEINNPVNALVNTVGPLEGALDELIERCRATAAGEADKLAVDIREMLRVIQRGARRTKEIVQALHNYSRGDDDHLVEVDLHRGIDESLDLLRHHLKHGIEVERVYGEIGRVPGYAGQLHQVFMNLLTNAAQAIEEARDEAGPQAQPGHIRIVTRRQGDRVVITVGDNGPGMPPDVLSRIFDPFFTTKEVGKGSGLGLSIVHGIVDRHGGTIHVESKIGEGTTFTVTLPLEREQDAKAGV